MTFGSGQVRSFIIKSSLCLILNKLQGLSKKNNGSYTTLKNTFLNLMHEPLSEPCFCNRVYFPELKYNHNH